MITYTNIVRYDNLEFSDYLKLDGYSHSFLKSEINGITPEFNVTFKVKIGKMVDAILTDPEAKIDMLDPLYKIAVAIANEIRKVFGTFISKFENQVSFTGDINFNGFVMPTKGRLDWRLPGHAVIDLKVTYYKDVHALIRHMGYDNQLFHYAHLGDVNGRFILIYSVPLKKPLLINLGQVTNRNAFWEEKVEKFGRVAA